MTFTEICNDVISTDKDEITKLIYLRRNYEIVNPIGDGYQVLSNLLHKRERSHSTDSRLERRPDGKLPIIDEDTFNNGCLEIKNYLESFDYVRVLNRLKDSQDLVSIYNSSTNGYEKLQLFRLLEVGTINSVIQKFVNETYHIENEYVCQLNPSNFDTIPEYVIEECDGFVELI